MSIVAFERFEPWETQMIQMIASPRGQVVAKTHKEALAQPSNQMVN